MSEQAVYIHTDLPGAPSARMWIHTDWIVVRLGDRVSCAHRAWMSTEHAAGMAAALAEASA